MVAVCAVHVDTILSAAADCLRQVTERAKHAGGIALDDDLDGLLAMRDQMIQALAVLGDGHKGIAGAYNVVFKSDIEKMRFYEQEATRLLQETAAGNSEEVVGKIVAQARPGAIVHTIGGLA